VGQPSDVRLIENGLRPDYRGLFACAAKASAMVGLPVARAGAGSCPAETPLVEPDGFWELFETPLELHAARASVPAKRTRNPELRRRLHFLLCIVTPPCVEEIAEEFGRSPECGA